MESVLTTSTVKSDCADWANAALSRHIEITNNHSEDPQIQISDLLADLMHLADRLGVSFGEALNRALANYEVECGGGDL